jgi:hypothetical protein
MIKEIYFNEFNAFLSVSQRCTYKNFSSINELHMWSPFSVVRCVCEKIAQNKAKSTFSKYYYINYAFNQSRYTPKIGPLL